MTLANGFEERQQSAEELAERRRRTLAHPAPLGLTVVILVGTVTLSVVGMLVEDIAINAAAAITVAVVVLVSFSVALSPMIAKVR